MKEASKPTKSASQAKKTNNRVHIERRIFVEFGPNLLKYSKFLWVQESPRFSGLFSAPKSKKQDKK
jgi:hypothetical protein